MMNFFTAAFLCAICFIFTAMALLITEENGAREQKLMAYFLFGVLIQNVGYMLELTAPTMEAAITAVKMQYLGSIFVPLCYCYFIYSYTFTKYPQKFMTVLSIIDYVVLALVLSNDRHHLHYSQVEWLTGEDGHAYLSLVYGPVFVVFLICCCVIPYVLTVWALVRAIIARPTEAANRRYKLILGISSLPTLCLFAYVAKLTKGYDPTPSVLGIALSLVGILIWFRKTYDFRRMATDILLESMGDGMIALDTQRKIISYNQAAVGVFPALASCSVGDDISQVEDFPQDMLKEEANGQFSLNDRFYESHTKTIVDSNQKNQGYVVLLLDVTDTRKYIDEIKRVREQAEKANTAKSEFLANMSHEIRTPMNAIIGLSDIIMEESVGRKMYNYAGDIKSASQNLLAIINDILDLSKVEAGKMELVTVDYHLRGVVDEVVHMMDIAASQRGLLMKHEYDETIPCKYHGDDSRIKQILINLLNNAIKFTKEGYVKISVNGTPGENEGEELLQFRVQDTGCGIREEDQEKIFENFRQVDSKRNRTAEGTGLGLSITRHLVHLMGGEITLESVYGEGTTFIVTIPQKIVDSRSLADVPYTPVVESNKMELFTVEGYQVLVVDDNLINRKVAASFLDSYKFDLDEADSGPQAIEMVKQKKYDIIFMDHMMPEMDGIEAARIIRNECGENGTHPTIIALTANAMEGVREMFLRNGFQDYLSKPLDRKSLNETLANWIPVERRKAVEMDETGEIKREENLHPDSGFEKIHIEGIDNKAVMKYQSGTVEDYLESLQLYCMDGKRKLKFLQQLFENKDIKNYEIEVHGLKSASANVGAMSLSAEAREHEEAAKGGDVGFIAAHFEELVASYKKQLEYIQQFLDKRQKDRTGESGEQGEDLEQGQSPAQSPAPNPDAPEIDRDTLVDGIREAFHHVESFHSKECAAKVEELLGYRLDEEVFAKLTEVREQLKLYEDALAEDLLSGLLEELGG